MYGARPRRFIDYAIRIHGSPLLLCAPRMLPAARIVPKYRFIISRVSTREKELRQNQQMTSNDCPSSVCFADTFPQGGRQGTTMPQRVSLPLTTFSYHSTRKKDFTERFFAKRSGERFKRGVRRSRTARKVCSAATTSVQKEIREPAIKPVAKGVTALCLLRLNLPLARLLRKSETVRAKMLPLARCREKPNAEPKANVGFL